MTRPSVLSALTALGCIAVCLAAAPAASGAWLDPAWSHRLELTVEPARISGSETFTDFTLLLTLDGSNHANVFATALADGSDLIVTAADGVTVLGHELVDYDLVAQRAEIWFAAPVLSTTSNRFYLYFGNPAGNGALAIPAAWSPDYVAVLHFAEDPTGLVAADSGTRGNFATVPVVSAMNSANLVAGQVGTGWSLDGQNDRIDADRMQSANLTYTISAWFAVSNLLEDANFAFSIESGFWHMSVKRNGEQNFPDVATPNGFITWDPLLTDNLLHHFVWSLDAVADTARFYFDGVEQNIRTRFTPTPNTKIYTGELMQGNLGIAGPLFDGNPFDLMEGTVDEFRFYEGVRSPAWIATEYQNQADPLGFYAYVEEAFDPVSVGSVGTTRIRMAVSPNPSEGSTEIGVEMDAGTIGVAVYDFAGRRVRTLKPLSRMEGPFRLIWDGRDDLGRSVGSGTYFVRAMGGDQSAVAKVVMLR